jgi:hypothetical protein
MNKMYSKKLIILSLMMMAFGCYAQKVKLSLVKGNKYEVSTKTQVNSTFNVMGQDMENNVDNTTIQTVEVKDTRGNETDLISITTKLLANMQAMGQDMSYDSDKKDNSGPLSETMDKIIGKIKNITIDASGRIIKEDKDDTETAFGSMSGNETGNGIALLQQAFIGKEMKIGASWSDSVVNNSDKMTSTTVGIYTISSVNKETQTATIVFAGKQTSSGTIEQMGQEMAMTTSSKVDSQFEVDINTGLIRQSSSTSNGSSTIDAAGMSIPVTIKSTTITQIKAL